jgi:hypothetical protein
MNQQMIDYDVYTQQNNRAVVAAILSTQIAPDRVTWLAPHHKNALQNHEIFDAVVAEAVTIMDGPVTGEIMLILMNRLITAVCNVIDPVPQTPYDREM